LEAYKITARFTKEERYGLSSQTRRLPVSVPSNIAEACGRKTTADYIRSLHIAYGSTCELETQILLSWDLGHVESVVIEKMKGKIREVERMLKALIKSLEKKPLNP
jgi:four helix bundle protein